MKLIKFIIKFKAIDNMVFAIYQMNLIIVIIEFGQPFEFNY